MGGVQGLGFRIQGWHGWGLGFRIQGWHVWGSGFRLQDLGLACVQVAQEQLRIIVSQQDRFPGIPALAALQQAVVTDVPHAATPLTDKDEVC